MKHFIVTLLVGFWLLGPHAFADVNAKNGISITTASTINGKTPNSAFNGLTIVSGGGGYTLFYNGIGASTSNWPIGDSTNDYNAGLANWSDGTARNIGKISVKMEKSEGSITGKTFVVKIYAQGTGNNLGSLMATSDSVTGNDSWSGTTVDFIFSTPYLTTSSTVYHFVVTMNSTDVSNYASGYFRADTLSGELTWWDSGGTATTGPLSAFDFQVDMYTTP